MEKRQQSLAYRPSKTQWIWGNKPLWIAAFLAVAALLSFLKPVVLGDGGAVTYFSLFVLWLITFTYGPKTGLVAGLLFGLAKAGITYITGESMSFAPGALVLEYPLACAAFALGAVALRGGDASHRDTKGMILGYLIGVAGMLVCYVISAQLFYAPEFADPLQNLLFNIAYDGSYLAIEVVLTLLVLCIPQVREVIYYVRRAATVKLGDPTLNSY